jgi:hypothetical protein
MPTPSTPSIPDPVEDIPPVEYDPAVGEVIGDDDPADLDAISGTAVPKVEVPLEAPAEDVIEQALPVPVDEDEYR